MTANSNVNTADGGSSSAVQGADLNKGASSSELEKIQQECASMINTLKTLHEEERQLRESNTFLAQLAALMGCTRGLDGGTRRGARRIAAAKKKAVASNTAKSAADGQKKAPTSKQPAHAQRPIATAPPARFNIY